MNLLKTKDGAYVINLNEYKSIWTNWIGFYGNAKNITCFDSFEIDYNLEEIRKLIENKNVKTNIYRIQAYHSIIWEVYNLIICGCFCVGFIHFMLKGKSLLDYTNLFSPNIYDKNDKIILKSF